MSYIAILLLLFDQQKAVAKVLKLVEGRVGVVVVGRLKDGALPPISLRMTNLSSSCGGRMQLQRPGRSTRLRRRVKAGRFFGPADARHQLGRLPLLDHQPLPPNWPVGCLS